MAQYRCSHCGSRPKGRLATAYISTIAGDGSRDAFKSRWCKACYDELMEGFLNRATEQMDESGPAMCPSCGQVSFTEGCEIWFTIFAPKQDPLRVEADLCRQEYPTILAAVRKGSTPLLDRGVSGSLPEADEW